MAYNLIPGSFSKQFWLTTPPHPLAPNISSFNFRRTNNTRTAISMRKLAFKSMDYDVISQRMLKMIGPVTLPHFTSICNCSYVASMFPAHWKRALINTLLKTPIPATVSDRRPTDILPELSKILERDAFDQLLDFLEENSLLYLRQLCYRRSNSTQMALIAVTDFVREAVEQIKLTILILFDFSKAFDSIRHR